jgi:hypothetical protein
MGSSQGPKLYEARVGFTPTLVVVVVMFLGLTGFWVWMGTDPVFHEDAWGWAVIVVPILFFGTFGVFLLVNAARGMMTLRVDQAGITLGRTAGPITQNGFWWRTPPVTAPWQDIVAVTVSTEYLTMSSGSWTCLGLELRAEAPLPGARPTREGFLRRVRELLGPDREPGNVTLYRHVFGWRVDVKQLTSAVKHHAPDVKVTDTR